MCINDFYSCLLAACSHSLKIFLTGGARQFKIGTSTTYREHLATNSGDLRADTASPPGVEGRRS